MCTTDGVGCLDLLPNNEFRLDLVLFMKNEIK